MGLIPRLGRSPGEGKGYLLQYSGLENSLDCIDSARKESDSTEQLSFFKGIQFSSVIHLCQTHCDHMGSSTPGLPVHDQLLEFTQTHVHRVSDAIQPSHPLLPPFSSCLQSLPASGSFPRSRLFASGGQSFGASAAASVLPMNIQG